MHIEIDKHSGFCFGVQKAISKVEELTGNHETLNCLGDIVHNSEEVERLSKLGMNTISSSKINQIHHQKVLIRTHGEPPSTYSTLSKNNNQIIDATCPVVLKLQTRVKKSFEELEKQNGQLVIFGKKGHAEVVGLNGQTDKNAIVVTTASDLNQIDFARPIELYSQTTMPLDAFHSISKEIQQRAKTEVVIHDTICRQVSNRVPRLKDFAAKFEVILFVSGKQSSNGKFLYEVCRSINQRTHFITSKEEIQQEWFTNCESIGICGATSTPQWLMEKIKDHLEQAI